MRARNLFHHAVIVLSVVIAAGCGGPAHMVRTETAPRVQDVKPAAGKAALVVARTVSKGFNVEFFNYVDRRFIGVTKGRSFFVTDNVDPGKRIFISSASNIDALKIDLKPGKVYCVQQLVGFPESGQLARWVVPGRSPFEKVGVTLKEISLDDMAREMADGMPFYTVDSTKPGKDLSDEEYRNIASKMNP